MKVLGLCCSPHKGGSTEMLLNEALKGALQEGADIELYSVAGKHFELCDGCRSCAKTGFCHLKDDMQELLDKVIEADAIIFGAPIYQYMMPAHVKLIMERMRPIRGITPDKIDNKLSNKVGGIIAVAASLGLIQAVKDLYFFIISNYMLPGDFVAVYAMDKTDIDKRTNGKKAAFKLGRQVARLAAMKFAYPADLKKDEHAYGTWDQ
ncbi:MAG: flavodoxin family protein [Dehalococcoidales bacterium]|nr:flavodoxin family protein [Dehalococcoidales bacterium]